MTKSGTSFKTTGGALSVSVGTAGSYFQGLTALTGSLSFSTGGGLDTSYSSGPPGVVLSYDTTKCPTYGYWTALPLKKDEMATSGSDANGVLKVSAVTGGSVTGAQITISTWSSGSYVSIVSAGSACSQTDTAGIVVTLDCGSNVGAAQVAFKCTNRVDASSNQVQVAMTSSAQFSAATSKPKSKKKRGDRDAQPETRITVLELLIRMVPLGNARASLIANEAVSHATASCTSLRSGGGAAAAAATRCDTLVADLAAALEAKA
jgi:hypothetical protein